MFKQLGTIIILAIGAITFLNSCGGNDKDATPPSKAKSFIEFANMQGYDNPIIKGMKVDLAPSSDVRWSGDLIDNEDNKSLFYTYVIQPDMSNYTKAVYKYSDNKYFGVEVLGTGDSRSLKFVFDNMSDNKSGFFTAVNAVNFDPADTKNSIPALVDNFTTLVEGGGYKFLDTEPFSMSKNNLVDDDHYNVLYTYDNVLGDNKTHAVYKSSSVVNDDQFIGVELINDSNPRVINFYVNGSSDTPGYFPTAEEVVFINKATQHMPQNSFLDKVAGKKFQLIIENEGVLTMLGGTVETAGDIVDGRVTYKHVSDKSPETAVYQKDGENKFFGVKINEGNLDFYFDNSSSNPVFWTTANDVTFLSGADAILATRIPDSALSPRVTSDNITADTSAVPSAGIMSILYNNGTLYLATDNNSSGQPGTLFTGVSDSIGIVGTSSQIATNAVVGMIQNSLQLIGTTLFIVSKDDTNVNIFNADGTLISRKIGFDNSVKAHTYAIGANSGDKFIMASNNTSGNAGKYRIVESTGFQGTPLGLIDTSMVPTSVIGFNEYVYMAGNVAGDVKIIKSLGSSILLEPITGSNGKFIDINGVLYIVVTDGGTKMYKITDSGETIVTGDILPMDLESITTDGTYVYITSRATNSSTLQSSVYTLVAGALSKVADAVDISIDGAVTPAVVSLGKEFGLLIIDVENIGSKNVLRYNNLIVSDGPFVMPN